MIDVRDEIDVDPLGGGIESVNLRPACSVSGDAGRPPSGDVGRAPTPRSS
jgi:hypothetical protein